MARRRWSILKVTDPYVSHSEYIHNSFILRINDFESFSNSYVGLGLKEIRNFLDNGYPHVYQYLPEPEMELPKVPKEWVGNVIATILEDKFSKWVKL